MAAVNFVTTIVWLRSPGMTLFRMPIFVWSVLSAQLLQLFFLPSLTGAAIILFCDLSLGTNFFKPFLDGDPVLYQHLFWFYSHPTVYVWVLPAFGIFSEIIPAFSRNPLFGYRSVAIATFGLAFFSSIVWVHHMFASGAPEWMRILFMFNSMLVAVPTGIKVFAWTATVWRGKLHLETPSKKRAIIAVAHTILVIAYHLILRQEPYKDLGGDYFDKQKPEATKKPLVKRLQQLGYQVSLADLTTSPPTPA